MIGRSSRTTFSPSFASTFSPAVPLIRPIPHRVAVASQISRSLQLRRKFHRKHRKTSLQHRKTNRKHRNFHLRYRNSYRSDIGVYLANALVPANDRVTVAEQRRDVDQKELLVDYVLRADPGTRTRQRLEGLPVAITGALILVAGLWWRIRPREDL